MVASTAVVLEDAIQTCFGKLAFEMRSNVPVCGRHVKGESRAITFHWNYSQRPGLPFGELDCSLIS